MSGTPGQTKAIEAPPPQLLKQKIRVRRAPKGLDHVNVAVFGGKCSGKSSLINTWITALSNSKRIHFRANVGKSPLDEPIHTTLHCHTLEPSSVTCWEVPGFDLRIAVDDDEHRAQVLQDQDHRRLQAMLIAGDVVHSLGSSDPAPAENELQKYGNTALKRQMHAAVFVIQAQDVSNESVVHKLAVHYHELASKGYQGVVVMSAPDELYGAEDNAAKLQLESNPYGYIYRGNGLVVQTLHELARLMRVPPQYVFGVINYSDIAEQRDNIDALALMALDKALDIAEDRLHYLRTARQWVNRYYKGDDEVDDTTPAPKKQIDNFF